MSHQNGEQSPIKEILIYAVLATSSLIMLGYTVHMFVGGLVSKQQEHTIMAIAISIGAVVIGLLARDVIKRRRAAAQTFISQDKSD